MHFVEWQLPGTRPAEVPLAAEIDERRRGWDRDSTFSTGEVVATVDAKP